MSIYSGTGAEAELQTTYTGNGIVDFIGNPGTPYTVEFLSNGTANSKGIDLAYSYSGICNCPTGQTANPMSFCINEAVTPTLLFASEHLDNVNATANIPDGLAVTLENDSLFISGTPTQAGIFNYTIVTSGQCGLAEFTGTITINQISINENGTNFTNVSCNGGSNGTSTVTVSGGTAPYQYSWSPSGGIAATATGLSAGTYTVTVTDFNGCEATQSFTMTEPAAALAATAASQANVSCNGGSNGTATVAVSGGTAPYQYSWSPSGGIAATATGLSAGTYTVTVTDFNGCEATQSFIITEPAEFVAVATDNGDGTVTASAGDTYQWFDCETNVNVDGATAQTFTPTQVGTYGVYIVNEAGCTSTSNCVEVSTLGVKPVRQLSFQVYPNPTKSSVTLEFSSAQANLTLIDAQGRIVMAKTVSNGQQLDLSACAGGIYFISIATEYGKAVARVVKH